MLLDFELWVLEGLRPLRPLSHQGGHISCWAGQASGEALEDEGAHEAGHSLYLTQAKAPSLYLQNQSDIRPRKPLLARILKPK